MARTKRKSSEITREHSQLLKGIQVWLQNNADVTPLELGVFNDIVERVENHAKHGAYVRVRIKNIGNRVVKKAAVVSPMDVLRAGSPSGMLERIAWTEEETDQLVRLYCVELASIPVIAERLERTEDAVTAKVSRLGIKRRRYERAAKIPVVYRSNGTLEAARRIRERRQRAVQEERAAD